MRDFRETEGAIEDMYATIQKKKKPAIEVDMVDNDLYGSTEDWGVIYENSEFKPYLDSKTGKTELTF